jgi:hypothetical protein
MYQVIVILAAVLTTAWVASAQAEDDSSKAVTVNDVFQNFGFTISGGNDVPCRVTGVLEKKTFLSKVPLLQKLGMLNQELTQADINTKSTMLAVAFVMQMAPVVAKEIFENNSRANICSIVLNLREPNVYGHMVDDKILSYSFDRATFKKIDWDHFEATNMPAVAHEFTLDPAVMTRVTTETR